MRQQTLAALLITLHAACICLAQNAAPTLLPKRPPQLATHAQLAAGPLRVRLLPATSTPGMMISVYHPTDASTRNVIEAAQRLNVGDSWFCGFYDPTLKVFQPYLDTGWPVAPYFDQTRTFTGEFRNDKDAMEMLTRCEQPSASRLLPFGVGEWENGLWIWWEPPTAFRDRERIFGISTEDAARLDRRGFHDRVVEVHRRWKADLRGRLSSMTGYAMLNHLTGEVGVDLMGIETAENIPATQVKRAFVRGAARQFGVPWTEDVSPWFGPSISVGRPATQPTGADGIYRGANAGHSPSMMDRMWTTAWFSGTANVIVEAASTVLFDVDPRFSEFPAQASLSEYGRRAQRLFRMMKHEDVGIPYAPFAVLINKHHGHWSVWGKPWGNFEETTGDRMTVRFFDQIFPGQSRGPGNEERYLCPSPYGDTFDVLVNDAERRAWGAYPVILAVGDIPWTGEDIAFLKEYVATGGVLAMNELNIAGWDRAELGLAPETFAPTSDAKAVIVSSIGAPLVIRRDVGSGCILVAARKPEAGVNEERAFPTALLQELASSLFPCRVDGNVETLVNRTRGGWALMIVNNDGFTKKHREAPSIDATRTQHVVVTWRGNIAEVRRLPDGVRMETRRTPEGDSFSCDVSPGDFSIFQITSPPSNQLVPAP